MPTFTLNPSRPSETLEDCAGQLAMLSDLLCSAHTRGLELTDAGLGGMACLLDSAAQTLQAVASLIVTIEGGRAEAAPRPAPRTPAAGPAPDVRLIEPRPAAAKRRAA